MTKLEIDVNWELVSGTVRKEIICEKSASGTSVTTRWLSEFGEVLRQDINFVVDGAAFGAEQGNIQ